MKSLRVSTNKYIQVHLEKVKYKIIGLSRQKSNYILESSQIGRRLSDSVVFGSSNANITVISLRRS